MEVENELCEVVGTLGPPLVKTFSNKKMSYSWRHFKRSKTHHKKVVCLLCAPTMPLIGGLTSNLKRHLQRRHPREWELVEAADNRESIGKKRTPGESSTTQRASASSRVQDSEERDWAEYESFIDKKSSNVKEEVYETEEVHVKEEHDEFARVFLSSPVKSSESSSDEDNRVLNPVDGTVKKKRKTNEEKFQSYVRHEFRKLENQINMTQHNQLLFQRSVDTKLNYLESLLKKIVRNQVQAQQSRDNDTM